MASSRKSKNSGSDFLEAAASLNELLVIQRQLVIDESKEIASIRQKYRILKNENDAAILRNRNKFKTNYDLDWMKVVTFLK
jgi:hypothetical protein